MTITEHEQRRLAALQAHRGHDRPPLYDGPFPEGAKLPTAKQYASRGTRRVVVARIKGACPVAIPDVGWFCSASQAAMWLGVWRSAVTDAEANGRRCKGHRVASVTRICSRCGRARYRQGYEAPVRVSNVEWVAWRAGGEVIVRPTATALADAIGVNAETISRWYRGRSRSPKGWRVETRPRVAAPDRRRVA